VKKRNTDGSKIKESQVIQMENSQKYKAFKNVASSEKIEMMLMKNTNNLFQAFSNIDQNLKIIMDKAEEDKDETYNEASKILEIEHQNVKNLVTSSFQQMRNYISAMKACQNKFVADSPGDFAKAVKHNLNLTTLDEGQSYFGFEPKFERKREQASNSDEMDSFNDTIFYDAHDAIIYNEIEKETKRDSNPIEYKD
jgi:hypothetical protein